MMLDIQRTCVVGVPEGIARAELQRFLAALGTASSSIPVGAAAAVLKSPCEAACSTRGKNMMG